MVVENTTRSIYLDVESKTVDPDHALWVVIRFVHSLITPYVTISLDTLWNQTMVMSDHRNGKTSFHVKFEGIGFTNYHE